MLEEILAYNKQFVENKGYESYITNKYPDKKIAILSCMDYPTDCFAASSIRN